MLTAEEDSVYDSSQGEAELVLMGSRMSRCLWMLGGWAVRLKVCFCRSLERGGPFQL